MKKRILAIIMSAMLLVPNLNAFAADEVSLVENVICEEESVLYNASPAALVQLPDGNWAVNFGIDGNVTFVDW